MKKFTPTEPAGVLTDTNGRVVFRFAGFDTTKAHSIPTYVETNNPPRYGDVADMPGIEAHPENPDLPDPGDPNDSDPTHDYK